MILCPLLTTLVSHGELSTSLVVPLSRHHHYMYPLSLLLSSLSSRGSLAVASFESKVSNIDGKDDTKTNIDADTNGEVFSQVLHQLQQVNLNIDPHGYHIQVTDTQARVIKLLSLCPNITHLTCGSIRGHPIFSEWWPLLPHLQILELDPGSGSVSNERH
jgi:hypothetical protein